MTIAPPIAREEPFVVNSPNGARVDPYYWLRDDSRSAPEVLAHLRAENAFFEQHAARYATLTETLFTEIKRRIKPDDSSVPYRSHGYLYYTRLVEGDEYPIYARKLASMDADEEIILDVNKLAIGHDFYQAFPVTISKSQRFLVYAEDLTGRRQYALRTIDLASQEHLAEVIHGTGASAVWSDDEQTLFYAENDDETLRTWRIRKHLRGSDVSSDSIVFEELDESFNVEVSLSGSEKYISIHSSSTVSDEQRVARADDSSSAFQIIAPRLGDFHYGADHIGNRWIIRTDWNAPNYCVMEVADDQLGSREAWQPLLAHDTQTFINDVALFDDFLVVDERSAGLRRLRIQPWTHQRVSGTATYVEFDEPAYTAALSINSEQATSLLRFSYTSLTTPQSIFELDMQTGQRALLKRQAVLGRFVAEDYRTDRFWAISAGGVKVPVSVVFHKNTPMDGTAPLLQYGYGSYGIAIDPAFDTAVVSLLDRGFVYAIAHVRGGEEMGRAWYEDGKKLNKVHTFEDFIAASEMLIEKRVAAPDKVFARGGSAGGLLMGAIGNMRGDLYRGLVANVPFVDVVTTMLDESIPLTTFEYDEWGNPSEKLFYEYMLSYSPYDNVGARPFPAMLVTTGLHDSQVQYFEPAKWVARLRKLKTNDRPLFLKTDMTAGHGGKSGRFARVQEIAEQYAFMLNELGMDR